MIADLCFWSFWFCRFDCLGWLVVMVVGIVGLDSWFVVGVVCWRCISLGILCGLLVACLCASFWFCCFGDCLVR